MYWLGLAWREVAWLCGGGGGDGACGGLGALPMARHASARHGIADVLGVRGLVVLVAHGLAFDPFSHERVACSRPHNTNVCIRQVWDGLLYTR